MLYSLLLYVALHGGAVQTGFAPHYAEGLMERVARNRDMQPVGCMVSSPTYPLDTWLWVYGMKTDVLLRCRVTDVSHPLHKAGHIKRRRFVELSYEVTRALCGTTRGRADECPVVVVHLCSSAC